MILKALKSNQPYYILFIPFIAIGLWLKSFIQPALFPFYPGEDAMILYQPIQFLLNKSPLAGTILALLFVVLLAFLILKLNVQYAFIRVKTFLPSSLFILITSGMHDLHSMHPVYPAALFLILAIDRIFATYEKDVIHSNAFDSGIYLAIGSLFYMNLIFFFPLLWIAFIILKLKVNWREYVLTTLGFGLPWIIAIAFYFATGRSDEFIQTLQSNISFHQSFLRNNLPIQIFSGFLIVMTLLGSVSLLRQFDGKKISSRRFFKILFWIFLIAVVLTIANRAVSQEIIVLVAIPLSYLISNYLIFMKRQFWGEVFIYLLVAGVIYLQFV